jgi:3-carboxy-cis,cis-muconate cycloisomerase
LTTFAALFVPDALREAVSDRAWFDAMVEAERALARAAGRDVELDASQLDIASLLEQGRAVGNPVEPLVRALRERSPDIHRGATSQDILDTAAMLVARRGVELVTGEVRGAEAASASLARAYRSTPMAARTILQQAVPTTFGYVAAQWTVALRDAASSLEAVSLPAQLGGAAGTLAAFGDDGRAIKSRYAAELGLVDPQLPWHTTRTPVTEVASALDRAAQAAAKIGLDVVLLAQTEVGELREATGGGSSTMPHKHNPARAVAARASARGAHAQASLLTATADYELQRAAGAWQAEWNALSELLALTGGSAAAIRTSLEILEVDAERMRANMSDDLYAERDALGLDGPYLGAAEAFVDDVVGTA